MSINQIDELIRIRVANLSAIKRRLKNVRSEHQREIALKELAAVEAEIEDLKEQREELQGQALKRATKF